MSSLLKALVAAGRTGDTDTELDQIEGLSKDIAKKALRGVAEATESWSRGQAQRQTLTVGIPARLADSVRCRSP